MLYCISLSSTQMYDGSIDRHETVIVENLELAHEIAASWLDQGLMKHETLSAQIREIVPIDWNPLKDDRKFESSGKVLFSDDRDSEGV